MKYGLEMRLRVQGPTETLADHVDQVTEQLVALEGCTPELLDSAIAVEVSSGEVDVEMTLDAVLPEQATTVGISCLRAAIHAAGGGTPDWDEAPTDEHVVLYLLDAQELRPLVPA